VIAMSKYIKNPIPVDAVEYKHGLEDGFDDLGEALNAGLDLNSYTFPDSSGKVPYIQTMEGKHYISNGDFIITGVDGERYPCKKSIFLKTYTFVNQ
jgi:hypothetical protein